MDDMNSNATTPSSNVTLDSVIDVLRNNVRRGLLLTLAKGDKDVSTLANEINAHISVISHNLRALRELGVVEVRRDARRRIYRLSPMVNTTQDGEMMTLSIDADGGSRVSLTVPR